jgi:hypothetical protein
MRSVFTLFRNRASKDEKAPKTLNIFSLGERDPRQLSLGESRGKVEKDERGRREKPLHLGWQ